MTDDSFGRSGKGNALSTNYSLSCGPIMARNTHECRVGLSDDDDGEEKTPKITSRKSLEGNLNRIRSSISH